jgi:hypothetical protein
LGAVLAVLFLPAQPATPTAYQAETAQTDPHTPDRATPTTTVHIRPIRRRRLLSRLLVLVIPGLVPFREPGCSSRTLLASLRGEIAAGH